MTIIFCTNYMSEQIAAHFGDGSRFGVKMAFVNEEHPLGTAGAIKNAQAVAGRDTFVVVNGDVLTDFDIAEIIGFHRDKKALVTLALKEVPSPSPYGVIDTDDEGRVLEFREPSEAQKKALAANPNIEPTGIDYINAGIYVMQPEALDHIPTGRPVSIERETYPALLAAGMPIYAVASDGYWLDIGRPEQYRQATEAILSRDLIVDVAGEWTAMGYWAMEGTEVDPTAHVAPTVHIGRHARVGAGASLAGKTVIGPKCRIGANATLTDCILEAGCIVAEGAKLTGVILDDGCHVEQDVTIDVPGVFAARSVIGRGTRLVRSSGE